MSGQQQRGRPSDAEIQRLRAKKRREREAAKRGKGAWSGWTGCLLAIAVFGLPIGIPLAWGLYDEGVFEPDLSTDVNAVALGPSEAARLADRLKVAAAAHGVCYGWEVDADTGAPLEVGSNLGVGVDARKDPAACPRWFVLTARYFYFQKAWSSASFSIEDNVDTVSLASNDLLTGRVVNPEGHEEDGAIGELADAIGTVPLLAAEQAGLAPLPAQDQTPDPTASSNDELASLHGAGWWTVLGLGGLLVALGLLVIIRGAVRAARKTGP